MCCRATISVQPSAPQRALTGGPCRRCRDHLGSLGVARPDAPGKTDGADADEDPIDNPDRLWQPWEEQDEANPKGDAGKTAKSRPARPRVTAPRRIRSRDIRIAPADADISPGLATAVLVSDALPIEMSLPVAEVRDRGRPLGGTLSLVWRNDDALLPAARQLRDEALEYAAEIRGANEHPGDPRGRRVGALPHPPAVRDR